MTSTIGIPIKLLNEAQVRLLFPLRAFNPTAAFSVQRYTELLPFIHAYILTRDRRAML